MKFKTLLVLLGSFILSASAQDALNKNKKEEYYILPQPDYLAMVDGRFNIDATTVISGESTLTNEGNYLAEMLSIASGLDLVFNENTATGNILLKTDDTIENEEGYKLTVRFNKIEIIGRNATGVFYGIQSLRQLLPATGETTASDNLTIPAVDIIDNPRFSYRGMHLDVARHFFPAHFIKRYIDILALHKMNTFHWHLTEDQGWRIEIKKYPKLTSIGAWRKETLIGHMSGDEKDLKYDGIKYGGFYTQEEIRDIMSYAQARHITIIPEIDLPGHSLAVLAAYPQFGNFGEQYEVGTRWGIYPQIYSPTEETFAFLEDVLSEVADLFPSKYIHIGGDEALKEEWKKSKYAQELILKEGLKDEQGLQSYFINRLSTFLKTKDKTIIGWDEIIEGGLAPGATVMYWRGWLGTEEILEAAEHGHDIIMTPASHCYFDHYQVSKRKRKKEKLAIGGYLPVKKVYEFEPIPEEFSGEVQSRIIGAQANLWTEYIPTSDHAEYMLLPRLTALSEVVWSHKEARNWEDFRKRLKKLTERYDELQLNYAKHSL